jgi:hypothetical protein
MQKEARGQCRKRRGRDGGWEPWREGGRWVDWLEGVWKRGRHLETQHDASAECMR